MRKSLVAASVCAAVTLLAQAAMSNYWTWPYPRPKDLWVTPHYQMDLGALLVGSHRMAANIAYIQFLQYYALDEVKARTPSTPPSAAIDHRAPAGDYPYLKDFALRLLRLDPYFNSVILEMAGALAFNQNRMGESLDVLREAIQRDPTFYRYHLYVTAILYKGQGHDELLINPLMKAIQYPDCPALLKSVLGNLLKKKGRYREAAHVYWNMYRTSADPSDRNLALHRLTDLLHQHPSVEKDFREPHERP